MCGKGSNSGGGQGALGWGGLAPAQQTTTQASPQALSWYNQAMGLASQAAAKPYQQFGTTPEQFVAQLNPQQQAAQQGIAEQAAATLPYSEMGAGMQAAAGMGNAAQMAGAYMNPFMQQVVSPVQQALQQQQGQQLAQQQANAIRGGAFGGPRSGIERAVLEGQQQLGMGQALSPLYQTGYGQALGAAQTDLQRQLAAGQGLSQAGLAAQQASLGAGTLGQQTQQAGINALYNQFQQQQMWPYMQAQFLGGLAGALGPLTGTQTYQAQASSPFGTLLASRGGKMENRMGGAVRDGGDYYKGGVVPQGYATKGGVPIGDVSYGRDEDLASALASQEAMYQSAPTPKDIPTSQIQTGTPLESKLGSTAQGKKGTSLSDILETGKEAIGLGKDIYGLGKGAYDWLTGPTNVVGGAGSTAVPTYGGGLLDTIGSGIADIGKAALSLLPFGFEEGGRVDYSDRGVASRHGYNGEDGSAVKEDGDIFERGVLGAESGHHQFDEAGRPLRSSKGAAGIAQIMPSTGPEAAKLAGRPYDEQRLLNDEKYNAALGRAYYNAQLKKFGTPELALAAYNAGPGRVQKALEKAGPGGDVLSLLPKETQAYVPRALGLAGAGAPDLSRMTPRQRSFMALDQSERPTGGVVPEGDDGLGGLLKQENVIPALMGLGSAISGMVGAKTTSPGAAIASGLGQGLVEGGKSFLEAPKTIAEAQKLREEAKVQAQEALKRAAEVGKVGAETARIGVETRKSEIENYLASIKDTPYGRVVFLANGAPMLASEFQERVQRGERVPLLGALPADAEKRAAEVLMPSGAGTTPTDEKKPLTPTEAKKEIIPSTPGVIYDQSSRERAKREQAVGLNAGPQAELAKKNSEEYNNMVRNEAQGARENAPYLKELSTTLADSYTKHGMNEPGFKSEIRAELVSAANTLYHSLGGEGDLGTLKRDQDIVNKISTLLSSERARMGNQHAFAALETMKNAIPNLSMDPRAGAELTSQLMTLQQRALDRDAHKKLYAKDSNGFLNEAADDFTEKSASRYQMESKIIKDLMLHHAQELKMMMSGHGVTPEHIEEAIQTWYGKDAPKDMYRYFAPQI